MTQAADPRRKPELARIHVGKKRLGLDDACYRDLLERETGKRSAADLDAAGRAKVLDAMRRLGFADPPSRARRPKAAGPHAAQIGKARALWLALWNLGAIEDSSDRALNGFVRRQTGAEALQWCGPGDLNKVIEGLKARCAREGFDGSGKVALIRAQWAKLGTLGELQRGGEEALFRYLDSFTTPRRASLGHMDERQLDEAAGKLGRWIRRVRSAARMTGKPENSVGD